MNRSITQPLTMSNIRSSILPTAAFRREATPAKESAKRIDRAENTMSAVHFQPFNILSEFKQTNRHLPHYPSVRLLGSHMTHQHLSPLQIELRVPLDLLSRIGTSAGPISTLGDRVTSRDERWDIEQRICSMVGRDRRDMVHRHCKAGRRRGCTGGEGRVDLE